MLLQQRFNRQGYQQEQKQQQNQTKLQQQQSQRLRQLSGYFHPMTASAHSGSMTSSPHDKISNINSSSSSISSTSSEKKRKRDKLLYVNLAKSYYLSDQSEKKNCDYEGETADTITNSHDVNYSNARQQFLPCSTSSSSNSNSNNNSSSNNNNNNSNNSFGNTTLGVLPYANIPATIVDYIPRPDPFQPGPGLGPPPDPYQPGPGPGLGPHPDPFQPGPGLGPARSSSDSTDGSESHPDNSIAELLLSMAAAHPMPCPALFLPSAMTPRQPAQDPDLDLGLNLDLSGSSDERQTRSRQSTAHQQRHDESSTYQVKHAVVQNDSRERRSPSDTFLDPL